MNISKRIYSTHSEQGSELLKVFDEKPCKEFNMKSENQEVYGIGTFKIITDKCEAKDGCEEEDAKANYGKCKNKLVDERVTYLNTDTGQYLYWIDTGIEENNGSWVVTLCYFVSLELKPYKTKLYYIFNSLNAFFVYL